MAKDSGSGMALNDLLAHNHPCFGELMQTWSSQQCLKATEIKAAMTMRVATDWKGAWRFWGDVNVLNLSRVLVTQVCTLVKMHRNLESEHFTV